MDPRAQAILELERVNRLIRRAAEDDKVHHISEVKRQAEKFRKFFKEGYAGKAGTKPSSVDAKQLAMGIKVEMEHTNDKEVARKIALDHLTEISDYYTRLAKMEQEAEKEGMKK